MKSLERKCPECIRVEIKKNIIKKYMYTHQEMRAINSALFEANSTYYFSSIA